MSPPSESAGIDQILLGDNLELLPAFADESFQLIYIDPPFNTGKVADAQDAAGRRATRDGERTGFQGRRYTHDAARRVHLRRRVRRLSRVPRSAPASRRTGCSRREGTLYFHIDYREAHYCKLLLDEIFGRECFLNEIIWAYDYGARTKRRWPAKHDTILVYVKDPGALPLRHRGRSTASRTWRPGLVTPEKAARGKLPTDVWWHTIVPTSGREKTGYPTQKPEGIVRRMVHASTRPGDWCLDFFAGSGTLGAVAAQLGRRYVLIDSNPRGRRDHARAPARHPVGQRGRAAGSSSQ